MAEQRERRPIRQERRPCSWPSMTGRNSFRPRGSGASSWLAATNCPGHSWRRRSTTPSMATTGRGRICLGTSIRMGDRSLHLIVPEPGGEPTFRKHKAIDSRDVHFAIRVRSYSEAVVYLEFKASVRVTREIPSQASAIRSRCVSILPARLGSHGSTSWIRTSM